MNLLGGANWRTWTSGLVETACLIVIALCALPSDIWSNPRVYIPSAALIIAKTVKDFVTKDKQVTGGSQMQTLSGAKADEGTQSLVDLTLKASKESGEKVPVPPMQPGESIFGGQIPKT